jgi:glutathione S-transferase
MSTRSGARLTLYFDPLATASQKALMALYEMKVAFNAEVVHVLDRYASAAFLAMSPGGVTPVLRDEHVHRTIHDSSVILEYVDRNYPGAIRLLPAGEDLLLQVRMWDRIFESQVDAPAQRLAAERSRGELARDSHGAGDARAVLLGAYNLIERHMLGRTWIAGEHFTLADCAAAPALFYSSIVLPFPATHPELASYAERLIQRPSFRRVLEEMQPWLRHSPFGNAIQARIHTDSGQTEASARMPAVRDREQRASG